MVTNEIKSDRVVLQLLGIEKKWVRSAQGEWVDKKTLRINELRIAPEDKAESNRKWWKFW